MEERCKLRSKPRIPYRRNVEDLYTWKHKKCNSFLRGRKVTPVGLKTYFCVTCRKWINDEEATKTGNVEAAREFWKKYYIHKREELERRS